MEEEKRVGCLTTLFRCKYCGTAFKQADDLISHKKKTHLQEIISERTNKFNLGKVVTPSATPVEKEAATSASPTVTCIPVTSASTSTTQKRISTSFSTSHNLPELWSPHGQTYIREQEGRHDTGNLKNHRISERDGSTASAEEETPTSNLLVHRASEVTESSQTKTPCQFFSEVSNTSHKDRSVEISSKSLNSLTCSICNRSFKHVSQLTNHMISHNRKFPCPKCSWTSSTIPTLERHIRSEHQCENVKSVLVKQELDIPSSSSLLASSQDYIEKKCISEVYKCRRCPQTFSNSSERSQHEAFHTRPFNCEKCQMKFTAQRFLDEHQLKTGHSGIASTALSEEEKKIEVPRKYNARVCCPVCSKEFRGATRLRRHIKLVHRDFKANQCPECPFATKSKYSYQCHIQLHGSQNPYKCPHCTASYRTKHTRKVHIKTTHSFLPGTTEVKAKNEDVKMLESDNTRLSRRRRAVHPPGYYQLLDDKEEEELSPPNSSSDEKDKTTNAFSSSTKQNKCLICGKYFQEKQYLQRHLRLTHEKAHHCPKCPFKTGTSAVLRLHLRIHDANHGDHRCTYCNARFAHRASLLVHKRKLHLGIKYFAPPPPLRSSRIKEEPSNNETSTISMSRKKIPLYTCQYCPYTAYWTTQVEAHEREAHTEIPNEFKCLHCTASFSQQVQLTFHMKWHSPSKNDGTSSTLSQNEENREGEDMHIENKEDKDEFETDMRDKTNDFECVECGKICNNKKSLYHHRCTHEVKRKKSENHIWTSRLGTPIIQKPMRIEKTIKKEKTENFKRRSKNFKFNQCKYCPFKCVQQSRLILHVNSHHLTQNIIQCSLCSASFKTNFQLSFHMKWHGVIKSKRRAVRSTRSLLTTQIATSSTRASSDEDTYKCSCCPYSSKWLTSVRHHETIHLRQEKFKCDKCTASYPKKYYLKTHMKLHNGDSIQYGSRSVCENYIVAQDEDSNFEEMPKVETKSEPSFQIVKKKKSIPTAATFPILQKWGAGRRKSKVNKYSHHCRVCQTSYTSSSDLRRHQTTSKYHARNKEILNSAARIKNINQPWQKLGSKIRNDSKYSELKDAEVHGTSSSSSGKVVSLASVYKMTPQTFSRDGNSRLNTHENDNPTDGVVTVTHQSSFGIKITTVRFGSCT